MKILLVGPFPPPHTGNSLPFKLLKDYLSIFYDIEIINLSKNQHKAGFTSLFRILDILKVIFKLRKIHDSYDLVYLSLAESFAGNLRDIFLFFCMKRRLNTLILHMLGGAAMTEILTPSNKIQFRINKKFISKVGAVIVEGGPQQIAFSNVLSLDRIHIVNNFAEDYLFSSPSFIKNKFSNLTTLNVLFLSNHLPGKGHIELLKGYLNLPENIRKFIFLNFAGKLPPQSDFDFFVENSTNKPNIRYHGVVQGLEKKKLFDLSHVFFMPTYYPYEGQPFSIIEAYSSGCFVVTTDHSGISYIFKNNINGFLVDKKSVSAITNMFDRLWKEKESLYDFGINNYKLALNNYRSNVFLEKIKNILDKTYLSSF